MIKRSFLIAITSILAVSFFYGFNFSSTSLKETDIFSFDDTYCIPHPFEEHGICKIPSQEVKEIFEDICSMVGAIPYEDIDIRECSQVLHSVETRRRETQNFISIDNEKLAEDSVIIAFLIAHEIGHIVKNHDYPTCTAESFDDCDKLKPRRFMRKQELAADQFAGKILKELFPNRQKKFSTIKKFLNKIERTDSQYPHPISRINAVAKGLLF